MIKLGDNMKRISFLIIIFVLLICLTGCGYGKNELYCKNKGSDVAKKYLKGKYNIDVEVTYTDPAMKDQSCFDASCTGGEATGPVEVITDYNGREITVNLNCFEDTEPTDDVCFEYKLSDYNNCVTYDGIYYCASPSLTASKYGENNLEYDYSYGYKDYTQLMPSYNIGRTVEKEDEFVTIFIPANKLNTTFLDNNKILLREKYYSGGYDYETETLRMTLDKNYYAGQFRFYPGVESVLLTAIK